MTAKTRLELARELTQLMGHSDTPHLLDFLAKEGDDLPTHKDLKAAVKRFKDPEVRARLNLD